MSRAFAQRGGLKHLYVALTRAVSQMYLICTLECEKEASSRSYATLLNNFVRSKNKEPQIEHPFEWGASIKSKIENPQISLKTIQPDFKVQSQWLKRLWVQMHPKQNIFDINARKEGLLVHDLMAGVSCTRIFLTCDRCYPGEKSTREYDYYIRLEIVNHPDFQTSIEIEFYMKGYFDSSKIIYTSR